VLAATATQVPDQAAEAAGAAVRAGYAAARDGAMEGLLHPVTPVPSP
jgi:hypothetical protein